MTISTIVSSLDEGEYITKTLEHLISLTGDFEIIVVDGGSKDKFFLDLFLILLFKLGLSPAKLKRFYKDHG